MFGSGPIFVGIGNGVGATSLRTQGEEEGLHTSSVTLVHPVWCGVSGKTDASGKRGLKMVKPLGVAVLWYSPLHTVQENS